jgi:DNA-binding MarR family transcriptional regulator
MGTNASTRTDVRHVLDGIRRIVHGLHESSREAERTLGVTGAQLFVLRCLADAGPLSVNDLARRTFTHQSSVSTVVARLKAAKLVERRGDAFDGRKRILVLTAAGRTMLRAAPHAAQERLIDAVVGLPPRTRRTVARALGRLADGMAARRRPAMFFEGRPRRA